MRNPIDRRDFLRTTGAFGAGIGLMSLGSSGLFAAPAAKGAPHAEKLGWRLGCQAYSFNRFTFYEAIDKNASLGLHCLEMYPGQTLSKEKADARTDESMSAQVRTELKKRLADSGVKLVCYGV